MHPGHVIEQVYLHRAAIDFRKSINGLSAMVEQEMGLNVLDSALYVFINRQRTKLKVLYWHRNGFCLWMKRLEAEKFAWPRGSLDGHETLDAKQFEWLIEGIDVWRNKGHQRLHFDAVS